MEMTSTNAIVVGSLAVFANIGLVGLIIRTVTTNVNGRLKNQDDKIKAMSCDGQTHMTEKDHALLCENAQLKMREHITHEMNTLKDDTFSYLRNIEKLIKNGNGSK